MPKLLPLSEEEDRARLVLRRIMGVRDVTGAEIARRTGMSPQTVSGKMNGVTVIGLRDMVSLGRALDVDAAVFLMEPDDAIRWVLDNRPEREAGYAQLSLVLGMAVSAAVALAGARVPSIAPVLQSIAENGREDRVMSIDRAA